MVYSMATMTSDTTFEWDEKKNESNLKKHGVSFFDAQKAFFDRHCLIAEDLSTAKQNEDIFVLAKLMQG